MKILCVLSAFFNALNVSVSFGKGTEVSAGLASSLLLQASHDDDFESQNECGFECIPFRMLHFFGLFERTVLGRRKGQSGFWRYVDTRRRCLASPNSDKRGAIKSLLDRL